MTVDKKGQTLRPGQLIAVWTHYDDCDLHIVQGVDDETGLVLTDGGQYHCETVEVIADGVL